MSVHYVFIKDGAKMMRPILTREEYLGLRNGGGQKRLLSRIRSGEEKLKGDLVQMNYSCLPNDDGSLKGSKRVSMSVGMDIDFKAPEGLSDKEKQAWLQEQMAGVPELVMSKKQELAPGPRTCWVWPSTIRPRTSQGCSLRRRPTKVN